MKSLLKQVIVSMVIASMAFLPVSVAFAKGAQHGAFTLVSTPIADDPPASSANISGVWVVEYITADEHVFLDRRRAMNMGLVSTIDSRFDELGVGIITFALHGLADKDVRDMRVHIGVLAQKAGDSYYYHYGADYWLVASPRNPDNIIGGGDLQQAVIDLPVVGKEPKDPSDWTVTIREGFESHESCFDLSSN